MALKRPLPSPNVMVPKRSLETRRPELPSVAYFMALSYSCESEASLAGKLLVVGMSACRRFKVGCLFRKNATALRARSFPWQHERSYFAGRGVS
jgi:hypothetical protein